MSKNQSDGGKGSKQRPTDHDAYSKNWDAIFGKKKEETKEEQSGERDLK